MKRLFSIERTGTIEVWEKDRIIRMYDNEAKSWLYFDYEGRRIPDPDITANDEDDDETGEPTQYGPLINGFYSYTTHDVEETVDGRFGLFGIKDKDGNVITEEKYWDVGVFSNGVCPVRAVNGDWGAVNEKGKLVLPCIYWDEPQFNKYGIAYGNYSLIDMQGNEIEGTPFNVIEFPFEDDRYYTLIHLDEKQMEQTDNTGSAEGIMESIYDTKERNYVVRDIPECRIRYSGFDGGPCVLKAAVELIDEYETVSVKGKGIIVGRKCNTVVIYDYYE